MNSLIKTTKPQSVINIQKLLLEFVGTFSLTYVASWTIIYSDLNTISRNGCALAQALVLTGLIWLGLPISGAHFNPAITISLVIIKQINWYNAMFYVASQFSGALTAAAFIYIQLNGEILRLIKDKSVMGIPRPTSLTYEVSGIWGEILGTYLLMYIYMSTCCPTNIKRIPGIGGASVGFATYILIMTLGELSGGGFNPAKALGPAIIAGQIERDQFIHFFGPILGAIIAVLFYRFMFIEDEEDLKEEEQEKLYKETQAKNYDGNNEVSDIY